MNRFNIVILMCIVMTAVLIPSCRTIETVDDYDDLVNRLNQTEADIITTNDTVRNLHLSVQGMVIVVDGENVHVFEYEENEQSQSEYDALTGSGPGLVFFQDDEPPEVEKVPLNRNCYHSSQFVLLYDGNQSAVLKALRTAVGKPLPSR